jgi:hypothetical protein
MLFMGVKTMSTDTAFVNLQQDIMGYFGLSQPESSGFYAVLCPICGSGRKKKTGGFRFDDDKIIYNCFRGKCDASTVLELGSPVSRKFKALMEASNITIPIELKMIRSDFQKKMESLDEDLYKKNVYMDIPIPEYVVPFDEGKKIYQAFWIKWFFERHTPINDVMLVNEGQYRGCCVIPMRWYDKTISYQYITQKGVYVMHSGGNTNVLYTPSGELTSPVILVEGTIDAKCFPNTCATLKSRITPEQAYHLRGRDVIMIPDRTGNHFIEYQKMYGWRMFIPEWECKDLNEAVVTYGVITVAKMIKDGVEESFIKNNVKYKIWSR